MPMKALGFERVNPVSMPLDPNVHFEKNPDREEGNRTNNARLGIYSHRRFRLRRL